MKNSIIYYSVGPLLYCPANNETIVHSLTTNKFGRHFSLAMCLEDTINDNCVAEAENKLIHSLQSLDDARSTIEYFLPKIFVRVRNAQQMISLMERFGKSKELVTGFILPKFALDTADEYIKTIKDLNQKYEQTIYVMPIFESPTIINRKTRSDILYALKEKLDTIEPLVLNIRVGGNDLCHMFGFRRHKTESIHSIRPIDDIFSDIITVFGMDYVVSGPVWEYFNGDGWAEGLSNELEEDQLAGFIGKTVIHPNQIEVVNKAFKVRQADYDDAKSILNWKEDAESMVLSSANKERMNEYKTHTNWALRTIFLAKTYGIA